MALRSMFILLQSTPAQAGTQKDSLPELGAQFVTIVLVIGVLAFIAISMIRSRRELRAGDGSTPERQDQQAPMDDGSLYVVVLGIAAVVFGFLVILLFADRFGDLSSALGFLTALFGAITGLVGTYFGIKSSSDARQGAQRLQGEQAGGGPSVPPTVTVEPANATKNVSTDHTVTATVISQGGAPAAGVAVAFTITAGPDTVVPPQNVVTDTSGRAVFRFTNRGVAGIDEVEAVALGGRGTASVNFTQQGGGSQQGGEADVENRDP